MLSPQGHGNPYAVQRHRSSRSLRFESALEQEYVEDQSRAAAKRGAAFSITGSALILIFLALAARLDLTISPLSYAYLLLPAVSVVVTLALSQLDWSGRKLRVALALNTILFGGGLTLAVLFSIATVPIGFAEIMPLLLLGVFFSSGLTIYENLFCCLLFALLFLIGLALTGTHRIDFAYQVFYMLASVSIGLVATYNLESESRRAFLMKKELEWLAMYDGLTALLNRRAFDHHLGIVWNQAQRENKKLGLAIIDIDHLKQINDRHGHLAGDACFRLLGRVLQTHIRKPLDAAGRIGGDEFVAVWFDPESTWFDDTLMGACRSVDVESKDRTDMPAFTVSIGGAIVEPRSNSTITDVLGMVDKALYEAKNRGRNTAVVL
jgi:diguanylate cyclase (GGDEF)-like protein